MFKLCGAGILPFRVTPDGSIAFLLGREAHVAGWAGSGKLSAFEGGVNAGEDDVDNAVREFIEESLGVVCDAPGELDDELRQGNFSVRVCVQDVRRAEEHTTYVRRFEWTPDVVDTFAARREALLKLRDIGRRLCELERTTPRGYPFLCPGDVVQHGAQTVRVGVATADVSATTLRVSFECRCEARVRARRHFCYGPVDDACRRYAELLELQREAAARLRALPRLLRARAVVVTATDDDVVTGVTVRSEWLEKMCVQEFTLDQLTDSLQTQRSLFRSYFLTVAQHAVVQFASPAASCSNVYSSVRRLAA